MPGAIYLVTGANRGIGNGIVRILLSKENNTVVAAVRDPFSESSKALLDYPHGDSSRIVIVKIDSKSETDATTAMRELQGQGISHLDIVIANSGICDDYSPVHSVPIAALKEHIEVNGLGPIYLYQATYPLLQRSEKPMFIGIGSPVGTIPCMEQRKIPSTAYGTSKAILHWIICKIHHENPRFISYAVDPGFVPTDMGNYAAKVFKVQAPQTTEETVDGITKWMDSATRETVGARFWSWDGTPVAW